MNPKIITYVILIYFALTAQTQDILTYGDQNKIILYIAVILVTNWWLNLLHQFRIIFAITSLCLMLITVSAVSSPIPSIRILAYYEIIGFTVAAFIFGTIDYNFRVSKYLDEQLLQEEKKKIEDLEKFKASLYVNLTHEFRTPLTIIMGITDRLRQIKDQSEKNLRSSLETIDRHSENLLKLINQILDLAKLESREIDFRWIQGDIIQFSKTLIKSFETLSEKKNIDLQVKCELPEYFLDYDEEKMYSILSNLVANALKFTHEDGFVYINITPVHSKEQEWIQIEVEDSGYGIGKEHLPHIFDRFYIAESGPTRNTTGIGIGLALTKELIKFMGGFLKVSSELGQGTKFTIELPATRDAAKQQDQFKTTDLLSIPDQKLLQKSQEKDNSHAPLILLVEDDIEILFYLTSILENEYLLEIARNGKDGVRKATDLIPDLVISDVIMPGKDGLTLCRELKSDLKTNHIPVILLTAMAEFDDKILGLDTGADAYLIKPFRREELLIVINNLIDMRKTLQQKYRQLSAIDKDDFNKEENAFINKVNALIEENLCNPDFNVADLAKGVFMSRMQLHRKLTATTNRSASNYIRSYRLHKARNMLSNDKRSISEIAYDAGFRDPNYFSKTFQKEFGTTPTEFRSSI